ncbi:putative mitochondrial protein, partial [Mucuna pruriens]
MEEAAKPIRQQQRRMNQTILDVVKKEDCMEVFMDNLTVYADSFNACLDNLSKVLTRCIDTNLVLNYKKFHFMVTEGVVLGHLVSNKGIGVDKSKIDIITSLLNPASVRKILVEEARCQVETVLVDAHSPRIDIEIRDKKDAENSIADHLSNIGREIDPMLIRDEFLDEKLLHIITPTPWFANICNFVVASQFSLEASRLYKEKLQSDAKYYIWDDPYLWRLCSDQVIHRCIHEAEINSVLQLCHVACGGGHYGSTWTVRKVLDYGLYWSTIFKDMYRFVSTCDKCKKVGMTITRRHEMPQQPILFCEVFDVWGIVFMGPFPVPYGYSYIMLAIDYGSRWVEAIATKTNDAKVVVDFLKSNIFYQFGVPKALISDQCSHFCNRAMSSLLHNSSRLGITRMCPWEIRHRSTTSGGGWYLLSALGDCLGKGHIDSQCLNRRTMVMRKNRKVESESFERESSSSSTVESNSDHLHYEGDLLMVRRLMSNE